MNEAPTATRVEGSDHRSRSAGTVVALATAFIALAFLKPWSAWTAATVGMAELPGAIATAPALNDGPSHASVAPTIPAVRDQNAMSCLGPLGVELLTLVRWPGHEVRTWQPTVGAIADDPRDPSLAPVSILSSHVLGVGLCEVGPGADGPSTTTATVTGVVSIEGPGHVRSDLGSPIRITLAEPGTDLGVLYGPPIGSGSVPTPSFSASPTDRISTTTLRTISPPPGVEAAPGEQTDGPGTWAIGSYAMSFAFAAERPTHVSWLAFRIVVAAGEPN